MLLKFYLGIRIYAQKEFTIQTKRIYKHDYKSQFLVLTAPQTTTIDLISRIYIYLIFYNISAKFSFFKYIFVILWQALQIFLNTKIKFTLL